MSKRSASPADIQVGVNIRRIRTRRRMSQEKLAEACGITFQQIQKYENGTNRIGAGRLAQIAAALDVPIPDLYSGVGSPIVSGLGPEPDCAQTSQEFSMLMTFRRLEPALRSKLLGLAEQMAA